MSEQGNDFFGLVRQAMAAPPGSPIVDEAARAARDVVGRGDFAALDQAVRAAVLEAGGVVLLTTGREHRQRDELGAAIDWLGRATQLIADDPLRSAKIRANLALALLERYELADGVDPADLDAAIEVLDRRSPAFPGRTAPPPCTPWVRRSGTASTSPGAA